MVSVFMKMPKLAISLLVAACLLQQACADFHLVTGRLAASSSAGSHASADVFSFAHPDEHYCSELEQFHQIKRAEKASDTFTSPVPICGVQHLEFQHQSNGSLLLASYIMNVGVCTRIEDQQMVISCPAFSDLSRGPEHYFCHGDICKGGVHRRTASSRRSADV